MRRAVMGVVLACALAACSGDGQGVAPFAPPPPSVATTAAPPSTAAEWSPPPLGEGEAALPPPTTLPAAVAPAGVATRLNAAVAVLDDAAATLDDLRLAGEDMQLTMRAMLRDDALAAATVPHLTPRALASWTTQSAAVAGLEDATGPREPPAAFPDWRIVPARHPNELLQHYADAQGAIGVGWEYLAAINFVETLMGRVRATSDAGAEGPMQFLPSTWTQYGEGDINDDRAAIFAAARLLANNGAPADMPNAIWNYNHDWGYVAAVEAYAAQLRAHPREYFAYYHFRTLYRTVEGAFILPEGYPAARPIPLP